MVLGRQNAPPRGVAGTSQPQDPKTELTVVLQRLCGRPLTKGDVIYEVAAVKEGFQATLRLQCMQGEEYVGDVAATEKEAEKAAAQQALMANADTVAALPPKAPSRRKQAKKASAPVVPAYAPDGAAFVDGTNPKTELVNALQIHCRRTMTKPDVVYETTEVSGQFHATVKLMCLEIQHEFTGQLAANEKAAEQAAAEQAMMEQAGWSPAVPVLPVTPAQGQKMQAFGQKRPAQGTSKGPDHKTELTTTLQKIVQRSLTKTDVVYNVTDEGGTFVASVKLMCLEGCEYVGQPSEDAKAAEHSAAQQAVAALADQAAAAPPSKRSRTAAGGGGGGAAPGPTAWQPAPRGRQAPFAASQPRAKGPRTIQPLGFLPGGRPFGVETLYV